MNSSFLKSHLCARTLLVIFLFLFGCTPQKTEITTPKATPYISKPIITMQITSSAFQPNSAIPSKYTCDGANISPQLTIKDIPAAAKSLALIMDDPDAPRGTFVHWVVWNLPPDTKELAEGATVTAPQGTTDFGKKGYGGPCPPSGTHRYFFKFYALDTLLDLAPGASKQDLEKAMQGHTLTQGTLMGTYLRS